MSLTQLLNVSIPSRQAAFHTQESRLLLSFASALFNIKVSCLSASSLQKRKVHGESCLGRFSWAELEHCGQGKHHFHSHSLGQNLVLWPYPTPREAEKCSLCVEEEEMGLGIASQAVSSWHCGFQRISTLAFFHSFLPTLGQVLSLTSQSQVSYIQELGIGVRKRQHMGLPHYSNSTGKRFCRCN